MSGKNPASWPTPRSQDEYERRNWKTIRKVNEEGGDLTLPSKTMYEAHATRRWPTPRHGTDTMCGGSGHKEMLMGTELQRNRGQLNSRWVLQLMGYPPDWCDLPDEEIEKLSKPQATRSSRKSSRRSCKP
jgi:hypothetical protein